MLRALARLSSSAAGCAVALAVAAAAAQPIAPSETALAVRVVTAACGPRHRASMRARQAGAGRVRVELFGYYDYRDRPPLFTATLRGTRIDLAIRPLAAPPTDPTSCDRHVVLVIERLAPGTYTVSSHLDVVPVRTEPRRASTTVTVRR